MKYRPEDKAAKKERLMQKAAAEKEGKTLESKKPICAKFGLNHVTYLIEQVLDSCVASICFANDRKMLLCLALIFVHISLLSLPDTL